MKTIRGVKYQEREETLFEFVRRMKAEGMGADEILEIIKKSKQHPGRNKKSEETLFEFVERMKKEGKTNKEINELTAAAARKQKKTISDETIKEINFIIEYG